MSIHDTFTRKKIYVQLQTLGCKYREYTVGRRISLQDGVYLGYTGCVVVQKKKVIAILQNLFDKRGNSIDIRSLLKLIEPPKLSSSEK